MKNSGYLWPEMSHLRDMIFYHDILGYFRERSMHLKMILTWNVANPLLTAKLGFICWRGKISYVWMDKAISFFQWKLTWMILA